MCSAMKSVVILQSYLLFTLQSTAQGGKLCSLLQQFLVQAIHLHLLPIHLIRMEKKEKERKKRSIVTTAFVHQHKTMSDAGLTTLLFSRRRFSSSVSS